MSEKMKLLPCPFCGSKSWNRDENGYVYFFHNDGCFLIKVTNANSLLSGAVLNKDDQKAWNGRVATK
jgi:hypothetical protein